MQRVHSFALKEGKQINQASKDSLGEMAEILPGGGGGVVGVPEAPPGGGGVAGVPGVPPTPAFAFNTGPRRSTVQLHA